MSFLDIATPFVNRGIKVFPLPPSKKIPPTGFKFTIEATTDKSKVAAWNKENPNCNVALLADDHFCFLEFDIKNGLKKAAEEMGQGQENLPTTLYQKSGRSFLHCIFKHTERSIAIGNRSVNLPEVCTCDKQENRPCMDAKCKDHSPHHHHEWFSFRAHNKYLVGAGSTHPNGQLYENLRDDDPCPVPDWILDFVEKHSTPPIKHNKQDARPISDDFDFDDFCEHYGISILGIKDDVWHVVEECPGVGYRHEGSFLTGFYWDGNDLGWSCFAQGCPTCGIGIGKLISFLNLTHPPYKGPIWEKDKTELLGVENLDVIPDDIFLEPMTPSVADGTESKTVEEFFEKAHDHAQKLGAGEPLEEPKEPEPTVTEEPVAEDYVGLKKAGYAETDDWNTCLLIKSADMFQMEELQWLWPNKIPKGKIIFFTGKPDCGKSLTLLDLIAHITRGTDWPDGSKNDTPPSRVLLAASEDDPKDTLIPRLVAAGADLTKVEIIIGTLIQHKSRGKLGKKSRKNLDLKRDGERLVAALKENPDITLLALDPISSFFGAGTDQNSDKDIRPVMDEISRMCSKNGLTVVGLIHSNKRADVDAIGKVSGATALAASTRAVWGFSRDGEDKSLYHMAHVKGNLSKDKSGLNYTIEGVPVVIRGKDVDVPRIVWGETLDKDADDILREERANKDKKDIKSEAAKILIKAQKFPLKAKTFYDVAMGQGISSALLKRVRLSLYDEGFCTVFKKLSDGWYWYMLDDQTPGADEKTVNEKFEPEDVL